MPDAEEMISLPSRVKKESQTLQDSFRLHYFPDIPVEEPPDTECSPSSDSGFERIHFKNMNSTCSDEAQVPGSTETPEEKKGPSMAEIKSGAFQEGFREGK